MADDLKKVILVLKTRYGKDISVFLYAHSFGGALSAAFLTTDNNQTMVKGWIDVDGAHNFPLKDLESQKMLLNLGKTEKNAGRNVNCRQIQRLRLRCHQIDVGYLPFSERKTQRFDAFTKLDYEYNRQF
jgi:pimeloyl-ACP methyl ester carboxylesterase